MEESEQIEVKEKNEENKIIYEEKPNEGERENLEESIDEEKEDEKDENTEEENSEEPIEEVLPIKLDVKEEENKTNENEPKVDNKKLITAFEYKNNIEEEPLNNIKYSDDHNNINFISLELLISKINDNNLEDTNKNIVYEDILLYIVYQKNALMTTDVFLDIINSYLKSNNINTALLLLNSYLINYFKSEILPSNEIKAKVIDLYKLSNKKEIIFKIPYDQDKKIDINDLIDYIQNDKQDKINSLGGIEPVRDTDEYKGTIIPEAIDSIFDIFSWDPIEIARQISLITQYLYRSIGCQELILAGWTKKDKMEKSPNITKIILRFNKISRWIMEEILSYDSSKDRAKVIEIFILVAEELRNLHNLNDCFAIITTFNHLCIKRLKKTWKYVSQFSKNKQKELAKLCSILKNFENIKNEFLQYKNNISDINELKEGCIPYLAPYLKDLAFLEEGHKYFNENKLMNIHKILIVGKIIKNIKESQMFIYFYKPVFSLAILSDPEPLEDNELTNLSESLEPKFKLNTKRTKMKRRTNSDIKIENSKSGLSELFLEYLQDYGISLKKKMTLQERIHQFRMQYKSISSIQCVLPISRFNNMSIYSQDSLRSSSSITN